MENNCFEPRLKIQPTHLTFYSLFTGHKKYYQSVQKFTGAEVRAKQNGISKNTFKKMRKYINILIYTANWKTVWVKETNSYFRYKINFITLTLPSKQIHTDKEIIKCLSNFLNKWQKRRNGLIYLWKAEVQDNGNIHFHITSNAFYHYKRLKEDWNNEIEKLGYVSRSKSNNPNSTDVHSVNKIKNLAGYICGYIGKKDLYTKILKRYHKANDKYLNKNDRTETLIPKNYFKNLKRKISNANVWNCSKPLKILNCDINGYEEYYKIDINKALKSNDLITTEHATILKLKNLAIEYPLLNSKFLKDYKELILLQLETTKTKDIVN